MLKNKNAGTFFGNLQSLKNPSNQRSKVNSSTIARVIAKLTPVTYESDLNQISV